MDREEKPKQKRKSSILAPVLCALFLAFALSSGMLGFVLGRNASASTGRLIDTIVLTPEPGAETDDGPITHYLTGQVLYPQGDPCANVSVRLGKEAKISRTDSRGKFYFSDVNTGEQTLEVLSEEGAVLASAALALDFSQEGNPQADTEGSPLLFRMPADARMLEVTLTIQESGSDLAVEEGSAYFTTKDGQVVDFSGAMMTLSSDSYAVTPASNVVNWQGSVLLPWRDTVITYSGEQEVGETADREEEVLEGVTLHSDGSVELAGGVVVQNDGAIAIPDGNSLKQPCSHVVAVEGGWAAEVEELPEEYVPLEDRVQAVEEPQPEELAGESSAPGGEQADQNGETSGGTESKAPVDEVSSFGGGASETSSESESPAEESSGAIEESSGIIPSPSVPEEEEPSLMEEEPGRDNAWHAAPAPALTPESTPTPEPTPTPTPGPLAFQDASANSVSWQQQSLVDLFSHREKGAELGEEQVGDDMVPVIAPGSSGYYEFQLENRETYDIQYTLSFQEKSIHLPILYSLVETRNNHYYMRKQKSSLTRGSSSEAVVIPAGTTRTYRVEWEWQYEDWYRPGKDNAIDTTAAKEQDRTYIVSLLIAAEQLGGNSTMPDDDTRYPGQRENGPTLRERVEQQQRNR